MSAKCIMIQGTASSVGKSLICAGLCRIFAKDGFKTAPFKSQNMALNSYITDEGFEMGRAQVVQAEAAGIKPDVRMNPVLLKPTSDRRSQVIINGKPYKNMSASEYYDFKIELLKIIRKTYDSLSEENDIIVIEGAGSPAEINLKENDIVNMGMAKAAGAPVIIAGDIDRGGVFASLAGTMMLLDNEEKRRVKGVIINKFRGDKKILDPGLAMLEDIIKRPVLGVIPYTKLDIDDEDSVTEKFERKRAAGSDEIDIVVIKLPRISNFTDFNALEKTDGVNLRYAGYAKELGRPDLIILPGTKSTIDDLLYIRNSGLEKEIKEMHSKGAYIMGICGGYQMLGAKIKDPYHVESEIGILDGMKLLDVETVFKKEKTTSQAEGIITDEFTFNGILNKISIKGYEIHMGKTYYGKGAVPNIKLMRKRDKKSINDGASSRNGRVWGTYLHGLFDNTTFTTAFINGLRQNKGLNNIKSDNIDYMAYKDKQYDKLACVLRESLDMDRIYKIIRKEV